MLYIYIRLSSLIHIYSLFTELNALISSVTKIIPHKGFHACMLFSRYEGTKAGWSVKALRLCPRCCTSTARPEVLNTTENDVPIRVYPTLAGKMFIDSDIRRVLRR